MRARLPILIAAILLCSACASPRPPSPEQTRVGQVTGVRDITVQGGQTSTGLGAFAGALLGGIAGSRIGGGYGRVAAATGGTIAGSMAGQHIEQSGTATSTELSIRFGNGEVRTYRIAQPEEHFRIGDTVHVTTSGGVTHITHQP